MFETKLLQEMLQEDAYLVKVEVKDEGLSFGRIRRNDDNFAEIINRHCGVYATLEEAKKGMSCLCKEMKEHLDTTYPIGTILPDVRYGYDILEDTFESFVWVVSYDIYDKGDVGMGSHYDMYVVCVSVDVIPKYLHTEVTEDHAPYRTFKRF